MIKKATIFDIKRFAVHDGDGIRTTVFFKGCPLRCVWCHNPEGLSQKTELCFFEHKCTLCGECTRVCEKNAHKLQTSIHIFDRNACILCGACEEACPNDSIKIYGKEVTVDELLPILLEDKDFFESSGGGVTLSGGECLVQADFCRELLSELKKHGISTAVDTSGFVSREKLDTVLPFTDIFLYDLKAYREDVHIKCTGQSNKLILDNLTYIDAMGKPTEIRIPYVPEYNDGEIEALAEFISTLKHVTRVKILPYHSYASSKYAALGIENTLPCRLPTNEELRAAEDIMLSHGIRVYERY